jgi:hypothetical protein
MGPVRALLVLVTVLSFATPQVSWAATQRVSGNSVEVSLSAPSAGAQFVRAAFKTDKTFSTGSALAPAWVSIFPPFGSIDYVSAQTCDAPHLDLEGPPLAPRPPPASL